jgi:DNA-binding NarL/FixJ family response regulator
MLSLRPGALSLIRILIVDDFRAKLRALLESVEEWQVCAEAENGRQAIEKHCSVQPHITVMDFSMPELNGLHASRAILLKCPSAPILLLTVFTSSQLALQAKKAGIMAFCSKTQVMHSSSDSSHFTGRDVFS